MAAGRKTDNKVIGLDLAGKPLKTIAELARERGGAPAT